MTSAIVVLKEKGKTFIDYTYHENDSLGQIMIRTNYGKYEYYRERYTYNENNQLITFSTCQRGYKDKNDMAKKFTKLDCSNRIEYQYDENGNIIKSVLYYPTFKPVVGMTANKKPQLIIEFEYDENNNLINKTNIKANGTSETVPINDKNQNQNIKYEFDDRGAKTHIIIYKEGTEEITEAYIATYK